MGLVTNDVVSYGFCRRASVVPDLRNKDSCVESRRFPIKRSTLSNPVCDGFSHRCCIKETSNPRSMSTDMSSPNVYHNPIHGVPQPFVSQEREAALTRKVLWKLDIHVLPPLALVSNLQHPCRIQLTLVRSFGSRILL